MIWVRRQFSQKVVKDHGKNINVREHNLDDRLKLNEPYSFTRGWGMGLEGFSTPVHL